MKILLILFSYLFGAFPTGYFLVKLSVRRDIREVGSRSTGATNVFRVGGWKLALPVMVVDILKGYLPAFLAVHLYSSRLLALICLLAAVIGHCYPVYLKFRGGKGVATTSGGYLYLAPGPFGLSLALMLIMLFLFRYVSLATLSGMLVFPVLVLILKGDRTLFAFGLIFFLIILFRHRENVKRLASGTERKFGERLNA